jgi:flagellar biosynthesis GTPase FlhF
MLKKIILLLFACILAFPLQAFAYSYGDPTKEDIAESFKLIKDNLDASPPNWNGAEEAYKVRRSEISSHFGESITVTLDQNLKNKQKAEFIANYRYVLYINIDRRFTYARKDIEDYSKAKLLIAKAKGTYDVLKPYIQSKLPNKTQEIETAFDKALKALGNPGLFGVGEEPLDVEEYDKQTAFILTTLKPLFPYSKAEPVKEEAKDSKETKQEEEQKQTTKATTEKESTATKPAEETKTSKSTEGTKTDTSKKENTTEEKTTSKKETKEVDEVAEKEDEQQSGKDEQEKTAANEAPPEKTDEQGDEPKDSSESAVERNEGANSQIDANGTSVAASAESSADHAPMERSSKTNPFITFSVIGAVIALIAGGVFFAKKKNFI